MLNREMRYGLGLLALLVLQQGQLSAESRWPAFRGADGLGQSADSDVPVTWNAGDVAWRTELTGTGHSSPCLWDDRVFLTGARKNGGQVERYVICLNRADGKVLWQRLASTGPAEKLHTMNGFATATCATDGERVVAFFGRGGIHCYDIRGEKLWSYDAGGVPSPWGAAASPIIVDDNVIQNCDAAGASVLVALDKTSGRKTWETARDDMPKGGWSTPVLINIGKKTELILNGEFGVNAYDSDTGRDLWFCKGFNGRGTPMPAFGNGLLYIMSGKPGDTYAVRPGGSGDVTASRMVWHTPRKKGRALASPALYQGYLLSISLEGYANCYDAPTGRLLWTERLPGRYSASPLLATGLFYLQSEAGETVVIKPGKKLDIVATNRIDANPEEVFRACLVPTQGQLLIRADRAIYCIGKN